MHAFVIKQECFLQPTQAQPREFKMKSYLLFSAAQLVKELSAINSIINNSPIEIRCLHLSLTHNSHALIMSSAFLHNKLKLITTHICYLRMVPTKNIARC